MISAPVEPSAVRVVAIAVCVAIQVMLNPMAGLIVNVQVVAHRHAAGFDDPRSLILALTRLVDEAFGALCGPFVTLQLLLLLLIVLGIASSRFLVLRLFVVVLLPLLTLLIVLLLLL